MISPVPPLNNACAQHVCHFLDLKDLVLVQLVSKLWKEAAMKSPNMIPNCTRLINIIYRVEIKDGYYKNIGTIIELKKKIMAWDAPSKRPSMAEALSTRNSIATTFGRKDPQTRLLQVVSEEYFIEIAIPDPTSLRITEQETIENAHEAREGEKVSPEELISDMQFWLDSGATITPEVIETFLQDDRIPLKAALFMFQNFSFPVETNAECVAIQSAYAFACIEEYFIYVDKTRNFDMDLVLPEKLAIFAKNNDDGRLRLLLANISNIFELREYKCILGKHNIRFTEDEKKLVIEKFAKALKAIIQ